MSSDLLTTGEAAVYLKVARQTLAVWRLAGRGPEYVKLGRKVAYRRTVLDAFIETHTVSSTAASSHS